MFNLSVWIGFTRKPFTPQLIASLTSDPVDATETYTWTSSDKDVATVDQTGKVTGLKNGTTTITATTSEGKTATCEVRVCAYSNCVTFSSSQPFELGFSYGGSETVSFYGSGDKTTLAQNLDQDTKMGNGSSSPAGVIDGQYYFYLCGKGFLDNNNRLTLSDGDNFVNINISYTSNTPNDVVVTGNIMALLDCNDPDNVDMGDCAFMGLFYGCSALMDAEHLSLPATTLAQSCYMGMFQNCTALETAPALPATTLTDHCYDCMFSGCTALTTAPALSATTLAESCYESMFQNCTALETAPALPATTLARSCYTSMFLSSGLKKTPALPATTLAESCYESMFSGCFQLESALELPATKLAKGCYRYMFGATSTVAPGSSLTTAPKILATKFEQYCCYCMFKDCTQLTSSPDLSATTLANSCCLSMFSGCTALTTAPKLPAETLESLCYQTMFYNCTSLKISTDGVEDNKIFTCPDYNGSVVTNPVDCMFYGTDGSFFENNPNGTPTGTGNNTYYYY